MNDEFTKFTGDGISISLIGATLAGWIPTIAAALSVIWFLIRIYETCTVQRLIHKADCKPGDK